MSPQEKKETYNSIKNKFDELAKNRPFSAHLNAQQMPAKIVEDQGSQKAQFARYQITTPSTAKIMELQQNSKTQRILSANKSTAKNSSRTYSTASLQNFLKFKNATASILSPNS
mmetsp:Transcript_43285/g.41673  ORF Transcript_43285/g.41673 Transcript_43285/m.41673 type:complete len:114 (+) Transcript_43285:1904-2245(+)